MTMRKLFIIVLLLVLAVTIAIAQDDTSGTDDTCAVVDEAMMAEVIAACDDLEAGFACDLSAELLALDAVDTLSDEQQGVVLFSVNGGLPDGAGVTLALFGDAQATNAVVAAEGDPVELPVVNAAGYAINLREGPGTTHAVAGTLDRNTETIADGRNAAGDWVRIVTDEGHKWVSITLVTIEGDINTLTVTDSPYTEPMQAFSLVTDTEEGCDSSGLLVQLEGQDEARIQINGADLVFSQATLLVKSTPDDVLDIIVLVGQVDVRANASTVVGVAGTSVAIGLGGENGVSVMEAPRLSDTFSFVEASDAPYNVLPGDMVCVAGLATEPESDLVIRTGPSDDYANRQTLDATTHYPIVGQTEDGQWWKLGISGQAWVPQDQVLVAGRCSAIEVVEAPPMSTGTSTTLGGGGMSLLPAGQSVWMANSGVDVLTGTCSSPPIAICNHLVAINPLSDSQISWRGQEPLPYTLTKTGDNTYSFSGRSILGNANVNLSMTLITETQWQMSFTTIFDSDPTCNHTFYYTAERQW